jgi:hypothetical protein
MDPLTALATITQLIGLFVQERRGAGDLRKQMFLDWLANHRHDELKELICNTHHLSEQVDTLLRTDHQTILQEIGAANSTLAQVMSRLDALAPITHLLVPSAELSDFAIKALCAFEESQPTNLITLPDGRGVQFDNLGAIECDEPRFLADDMDALEACGFIRVYAHHEGYSVYELTRAGARYAKILQKQ